LKYIKIKIDMFLPTILMDTMTIRNTEIPLVQLLFHDLEDLHKKGLVKDIRSIETVKKEQLTKNTWEVERLMEIYPFFFLMLPSEMYACHEKGHLDTTDPSRHCYTFIISPSSPSSSYSSIYTIEGTIEFLFQEEARCVEIQMRLECVIQNKFIFFREKIQKKLATAIMDIYFSLFRMVEITFSPVESFRG